MPRKVGVTLLRNKGVTLHRKAGVSLSGISTYTRLVSYNVETIDKENVNDQIVYVNKDAFLLQAGTTYNFTKKTGLNFKASLPIRVEGLSWTLAVRLIYMLN